MIKFLTVAVPEIFTFAFKNFDFP